MAKNTPSNNGRMSRNLIAQLRNIRDRMGSIYQDTYSTDPEKQETLDRITTDIETVVSDIMGRNKYDASNISQLYTKMKLDQIVANKEYTNGIMDFFNNSELSAQLLNTYMDNKWIRQLDREIDIVLKYMPKLGEALDSIKDAVLSADNFEKDFASMESSAISPKETAQFAKKTDVIKDAYEWNDKVEQWYENTSTYGETFVYKVPYSKALSVLLARKNNITTPVYHESVNVFNEASYIGNAEALKECSNIRSIMLTDKVNINTNLKIEIYNNGLLESAVNESKEVRDLLPIAESKSIHEMALAAVQESKTKLDQTIPDKLEYPKDDATSQDGLIGNKSNTDSGINKIKVPGMLLRTLDRSNVIMLYVNDNICLGYYYIEFVDEGSLDSANTMLDNTFGLNGFAKSSDKQRQSDSANEILQFISSQIVNQLDAKFVNANPNLAKEIYAILDYNDIVNNPTLQSIRCTFIPPQDIEHITFKKDPVTHRGISDLARSLIPAKLWCCLYITYAIGIMTRGQDKRVYYVKQNVEQNIAQTLLNVIDQIKKNNFNIMQIENMNSILNMTGQFNDYVIPVGMSGDSPISMEVMQGQEIDPKTDFMDKLEEHAITRTGCPIEWLTAKSQLDFATQVTMTNNKVMRFVYKRQSKYEKHLSNIATDIYNTEFPDESNITIMCILPAPLFLNMSNFSQILETVKAQAQSLAEIMYSDDDPDTSRKRQLFIQQYVYMKMAGYLKKNEIDRVKNIVDMEMAKSKDSTNQEE